MHASATKRKTAQSSKRRVQPVQLFQRAIEREKPDLRAGLSSAIDQCTVTDIPSVVSTLIRNTIYRHLVAGQPFRRSLLAIPEIKRLEISSPEKAFMWHSCIASTFKPELARYVNLRTAFEHQILYSEFESARATLDEIEKEFGQSLWLIKNRILLLQFMSGIAAQKAYVNELFEHCGNNLWLGAIAYYKSMLCEPNVSFDAMCEELTSAVSQPGLGDYVIYHLLPYYLTNIESIPLILSYEEMQTIIDRFEAIVSMACLEYARGNTAADGYVYRAIERLESIGDKRLNNLLTVTRGYDPKLWVRGFNSAFDDYTLGNYGKNFEGAPYLIELEASISAISSRNQCFNGRPQHTIDLIEAIKEFILLTEKSSTAINHLKKFSLSFSPHPVSTHIAALLERKHDYIHVDTFSQLDYLAALLDCFENPWSATAISDLKSSSNLIDELAAHANPHSTIQLMHVLRSEYNEGAEKLDAMTLPQYRMESYKGHLARLAGKNDVAVVHYRNATAVGNPYVSKRVSFHLYSALFSLLQYEQCVELILDQCLSAPNSLALFPIHQLIEAVIDNHAITRKIEYPIIVYLSIGTSAGHISTNLSDAFENFLMAEGIEKPSELELLIRKYKTDRLVFFLRHISTLKVLEELTIFDNMAEVESERIKICQILTTLDPDNSKVYSSEIKEITRNANNAELLRMVQSSKIFVDEDGLLTAIDCNMRDLYARFVETRELPESRTEQIELSQKLGNIFKKDLAAEEQSSSELESLFGNILHYFTVQFATNAAYGLNTHISTSIRHHPFEGHFRSAFDREGLLCFKAGKSEYQLSPKWKNKLRDLDKEAVYTIEKSLTRFTEVAVDEIQKYITQLLYVKHLETNPNGMINLLVNKQERLAFLEEVRHVGDYDDFIKRLFEYCWSQVDKSLSSIRNKLSSETLPYIDRELTRCESKVATLSSHHNITDLLDSFVRARTGFQVSVNELCGWFQRPKELSRVPFEMESAIDVAIAQIRNCWTAITTTFEQRTQVPFKICGDCLDAFVEILFIFFQNIIIHSGQSKENVQGKIAVEAIDDGVLIMVENPIPDINRLYGLRDEANAALCRYGSDHDHSIKMAGTEGGSGLSKVWWILEYDLRRQHWLNIEVSDDGVFRITLLVEAVQA